MAASGYTPISLYYSTTAAAAPVAGNLVNGELAINITDGKLYYKNNAGVVKVIAGTGGTGVVAGSNTQVQYNNNGVFGASANLTFNGTTLTANTLNLTNQLTTAYGGTGLTSYTAGDLPYYATGTALSKLGIGTSGQILTSTGTAPQWTTLSGVAVTTLSFGTTGLTPSTATSGAITVAGTLVAANGGTGQSSYTIGDLLYASGSTTLSKLADVATGNALISGGVGAAPSYGKIGLTTHVSGVLPIANGGTNSTATPTDGGVAYGTGTAYAFNSAGTTGQLLQSNGAAAPTWLSVVPTTNGGTGQSTFTAGDMTYYATGTSLTKLGIGTSGQILTSTGTAPQWSTLSGVAVTTFSGGTTGLTPAVATSGAITLGGTLITSNGGTGLSTYTAGDLLYYSTGTTLTKLGIGAANYVLTSSGSAPQWVAASSITVGAAGSNTQIQFNNSGVLGASSGLTWNGTTLTASNISTAGSLTLSGGTANSVVYLNASKVATTTSTFAYNSTGLGVGTSNPLGKAHIVGGNSNNLIVDNGGEQYTTVQWYNNGVEKAQQYWDQTNSLFVAGTDVAGAYAFKTNTTERMRISSAGNVSVGTASTPIKFLVNGTDAVGITVGTTLQRPTGAAGYIRFNSTTTEFEGHNGTAWTSIGGSAISNDTTTATALYPLFASATSGTALTVYTSNNKLLYTPSTGELKATTFNGTATNAVNVVSGGTIASNVTATTQSAGTNNTTVATTAYVLANSVTTYGSGCVYENSQTITSDYTMTSGKNGMSAGPIEIATGVTVTIPDGSNWVIN